MKPRGVGIFAIVTPLSMGTNTAFAHQGWKPGGVAPNIVRLTGRLRHTVEIGTRGDHFRQLGRSLTIRDGRGTVTLTAVVGGRYPTVDALGQTVFFWHNRVFIGISADNETPEVVSLKSPAPGTFVIWYAQYRPTDSVCCPSSSREWLPTGGAGTTSPPMASPRKVPVGLQG